ncbi:MAG: hypothetical protein AAFU49_06360 [Pseudomonadota bacterium]
MSLSRAIPALVSLLIIGGTLLAHASEAQRQLAAENFMQADVNADGALTRSEFRTLIDLNAEDGLGRAAMVKRFGRYDTAFGRVDQNCDGLVTPEEMKTLAEAAKS